MAKATKVLDHGYVKFIEAWGRGEAKEFIDTRPDYECGIIEAARQSTQGAFRSWAPYESCEKCGGWFVDGDEGSYNIDPACRHEWKKYPKGDEGLLQFLFNAKPQHATPFEFGGLVIEVQAPIFVFREWHRHRTQSYNEMSARYAPLPDLNYVPTVERLMVNASGSNRQANRVEGSEELTVEGAETFIRMLNETYYDAQQDYAWALKMGVPKELARVLLPVGRYSRMRAHANLRNWLAFLTLREDKGAQWEIRQFAHALGAIISEVFPRTWKQFDLGRAA